MGRFRGQPAQLELVADLKEVFRSFLRSLTHARRQDVTLDVLEACPMPIQGQAKPRQAKTWRQKDETQLLACGEIEAILHAIQEGRSETRKSKFG